VEHVGLFNGHLEYIKAFGSIFSPYRKILVIWCIFPCFGILYQEKSGNPGTFGRIGTCSNDDKMANRLSTANDW
jgi:hypothetical protein